jgi:MurNAc alpha-1-phosphate uridylyltransferase
MLPIAILCGGKGTRIAAVAGDVPKALVPVAGAPFIDHQLRWLCGAGAREVVLLIGYRGELIREHVGDGSAFGLNVRYRADGPAPRGTAGALKDARGDLGSAFLTVYGDSLLLADPGPTGAALRAPYEGVMTVYPNGDRWEPSNARLDGDRVAAYDKQAPPGSMTHIDYGINAFRASVFDGVADDRPVDLADVHRALIERRTLRALAVTERWYEVGTPEGLAETENYIRARAAGETRQT